MVDYETDFYCKLSRYRKEVLLWSGRATWGPTGVRMPGGLRRGKMILGRRPHPAYYGGRRVHTAYYRKYIVRRPTPYGIFGWQDRFGSILWHTVNSRSVCTWSGRDPLGTWTWGGLYDYQTPYVEAMWIKGARKRERPAANADKDVR